MTRSALTALQPERLPVRNNNGEFAFVKAKRFSPNLVVHSPGQSPLAASVFENIIRPAGLLVLAGYKTFSCSGEAKMFKRFYAVMLICVFLLSVAQLAEAEEKRQAIKIMNPGSLKLPTIDKDGYCAMFQGDLNWNFYNSDWEAGAGAFVYYDPAECKSSPYPDFEITGFTLALYDPGGYNWPAYFDVVVYDMLTGDSTGGPGTELF
ncbi:MAG: hypothetical protein ABIE07_08465 [Candidatus Zixiibacteriota bacterium]